LPKIWEKCTFILDTNCLLDLYEYPSDFREEILKALKNEDINKRLWIPYHVWLEFNKNRAGSVKKALRVYDDLTKDTEGVFAEVIGKVEGLEEKERKIVKNYDKYTRDLEQIRKEIIEEISIAKNKQPFSNANGEERDELSVEIISDIEEKIGRPPPSQEYLENIYKEGYERYKEGKPPGFTDKADKEGDWFTYNGLIYECQYGDLIIWKQIIEYAKKNKTKYIIFVNNEKKGDWWYKKGSKTEKAQAELIREIREDAGVEYFHMNSVPRFLKNAKKYLDVEITDETLNQMETAEKQKEVIRGIGGFYKVAVRAFHNWLLSRYPYSKIEFIDYPEDTLVDFVVTTKKQHDPFTDVTAYTVKACTRPLKIAEMNRHWVGGGKGMLKGAISSFRLVIITPTIDLAKKIRNNMAHNSGRLRPALKYIIGYVDTGLKGEPIFEPLPKEYWTGATYVSEPPED
ncbi:MAG: DUF4935 domain-containing protein, partial [bacterium]|nr:DUF4935 domain-containing protein [bacterium]